MRVFVGSHDDADSSKHGDLSGAHSVHVSGPDRRGSYER